MKIRPAEVRDVLLIAEVYRHNHMATYKGLLPEAYFFRLTMEYCVEKWRAYLVDPANKIWVAYDEEVFLGFVAGFEEAEIPFTWYLDSLHVTEAARGKGVGTALIKIIGAYARENGYTQMSINIFSGLHGQRQFIGSKSFRQVRKGGDQPNLRGSYCCHIRVHTRRHGYGWQADGWKNISLRRG